jgi:hypothetical protein
MKPSIFDVNVPRDTKIPSGQIPLIILHWLCVHYYGGGLTPMDMRKFLEEKLRSGFYTREAVRTWIRSAECWQQQMDQKSPGAVNLLLAEYLGIKIAA